MVKRVGKVVFAETLAHQLVLTAYRHSFIHSVFCLTTGPKPPPKQFLHIVRSTASSFKWQNPLLSLRSSSSFLRLLPRLLATSISPFIFPSITCFRRHFYRHCSSAIQGKKFMDGQEHSLPVFAEFGSEYYWFFPKLKPPPLTESIFKDIYEGVLIIP